MKKSEKLVKFEKGQLWQSPDKKELFIVISHNECGCEILRPLHLRSSWGWTHHLGLPLDDFSVKYYTEHKYKLVKKFFKVRV